MRTNKNEINDKIEQIEKQLRWMREDNNNNLIEDMNCWRICIENSVKHLDRMIQEER